MYKKQVFSYDRNESNQVLNSFSLAWPERIVLFVSSLIEKVGKIIIGTLVWVKLDKDFVFPVAIEKEYGWGLNFCKKFYFYSRDMFDV